LLDAEGRLPAAEEEEKEEEEGEEEVSRRLAPAIALALAAMLLGAAGAHGKLVTRTLSSGDINAPLPAGAATGLSVFKQSLKVKGKKPPKIKDVNVSIRLTNANPNGDFKHLISLRAPNGTLAGLAGERAGAGYGSGASSCGSTFTVFDDEALVAWSDPGAVAPFNGPHRPTEPLSAIDGSSPNGTWDLLITSNYGNFGAPVLNCWQITLQYDAPKKKRKKRKK
jgi:hypothetical protein